MYRFVLGFALGVYVGTHYDCKPALEKIERFLRDNTPNEK